jgi:hypothetical protein
MDRTRRAADDYQISDLTSTGGFALKRWWIIAAFLLFFLALHTAVFADEKVRGPDESFFENGGDSDCWNSSDGICRGRPGMRELLYRDVSTTQIETKGEEHGEQTADH